MKPWLSKRLVFAGKSLLWSVLLYVVCMLALNWDEVTNSSKHNLPVAHNNNYLPAQPVTSTTPDNTGILQTNTTATWSLFNNISAALNAIGHIAASTVN